MADNISRPVFNWLRAMKLNVSRTFIEKQLRSHPDYPSLACLTERLEEWGLKSAAVVVDKSKLDELPLPFLAHYSQNDGEFVVIKGLPKGENKEKEFLSKWDGIAVFGEAPEVWSYPSNEEQLKSEKRDSGKKMILLLLVLVAGALAVVSNFSWSLLGLLILSITGFAVSALITQEELGISNEITEQLCSAGKQIDCKAVLNSEGSKLGEWFTWGDAVIIYFSSFYFLVIQSYFSASVVPVLPWLTLSAIPITFFSLYNQWRVIKKWCTLCLLTIAVLWLQAAVSAAGFPLTGILNLPVDGIAILFFSVVIIGAGWLTMKSFFKKQTDVEGKRFSLQRFKHTKEVFHMLLMRQRKVISVPFKNDVQIGNPIASIQLLVACNPYCSPCAKAHEILHRMVERSDIGLTIRFSTLPDEEQDRRTIAAKYLLQLMGGLETKLKRQILKEWYEIMDLEIFSQKHPLAHFPQVDDLLRQCAQWIMESEVGFTPTIYVNGFELPKQYRVEDLEHLVHSGDNLDNSIYQQNFPRPLPAKAG